MTRDLSEFTPMMFSMLMACACSGDTVASDITRAQMLSNSAGMVGLLDDPYYLSYLCQYTMITGSPSACARAIYTAHDDADRVPPDTTFRYGGAA